MTYAFRELACLVIVGFAAWVIASPRITKSLMIELEESGGRTAAAIQTIRSRRVDAERGRSK